MSCLPMISFAKLCCIHMAVTLVTFCVFCFLVPIILFIMSPFLILRWTVSKFVQVFKMGNLGKMLNTKGVLMTMGNVYENPKNVIVAHVVLEGSPDINSIRGTVKERLIDAKDNRGDIKFPELRQNLTNWMGFYFWKDLEIFNMDEHVYLYESLNGESKELTNNINVLVKYHLQKCWSRDKALWEIVVVPLSEEGSFRVLFRFHHALFDGYSITKFIDCLNTSSLGQTDVRKLINPTVACTKWGILPFPIKAVWVLSYNLVTSTTTTIAPTTNPFQKDLLNGTCSMAGIQIPLTNIKEVKNNLGIGFSSLLASMAATGLTKFFDPCQIKGKLSFNFPTPLKYVDKFRNNMSFVLLNVQMGEGAETMMQIDEDLQTAKLSNIHVLMGILMSLLGCMPSFILNRFISNTFFGPRVVITNISRSEDPWEMAGYKAMNVNFVTSVAGTSGIVFGAVTHEKHLSITVSADTAIIPTDADAAKLLYLLNQELRLLSKFDVNVYTEA